MAIIDYEKQSLLVFYREYSNCIHALGIETDMYILFKVRMSSRYDLEEYLKNNKYDINYEVRFVNIFPFEDNLIDIDQRVTSKLELFEYKTN